MLRSWVVLTAALAAAACRAGIRQPPSPPPSPQATMRTVPVEVSPSSGAVGTVFRLVARGFGPQETVTVEIGFPDGTRRPGKQHTATDAGVVRTTWKATAGNPPGEYTVIITGTEGLRAEGSFTVEAPRGRHSPGP